MRTMDEQIRESIVIDHVIGTMSAAFASLATLLAAIGLYGVLAYTMAQRTREIGLRMALGADRAAVRDMVLRQVARMTLVGGLIGIVAAIGIGRAASSMLYEIQAHDPIVMTTSVVLLLFVAGAAALVPAQRASRINPDTGTSLRVTLPRYIVARSTKGARDEPNDCVHCPHNDYVRIGKRR